MIVTEAEAKTKRCQESFAPPLSDTGHMIASSTATAIQTAPAYCIGSACMAWEHHKDATEADYEDIKTRDGALPTHGSGWERCQHINVLGETSLVWRREIKPARAATGYCGKVTRR